MIAAIILAAGESKRMGKPKLLLPFGGKTIIEAVISNVLRSKTDKILVILGSDAERIEEKIKGLPLKITVNPKYRKGMLSSVQWGFNSLSKDIRAFLIVLGDQPSISDSVIDEVIDAYRRTKKGIVIPVYERVRGHPVLIDQKYRKEVESLNPDIGLRQLVYSHPEDSLEVKVKSSSILRDIDDADNYRKELNKK